MKFRVEKLEKRLEAETRQQCLAELSANSTNGEQNGDESAIERINMTMVQALGTATMNHHVAQRDVRDLLNEVTQPLMNEPTYDLLTVQMGKLRTARERTEKLREERTSLESEIQKQPWFDSITAADADRAAVVANTGPGPYIGDEAGITAGLLRLAQLKRNHHAMAWMLDTERL